MKKQKETQEEYQKANFSNQPANVVAKVLWERLVVRDAHSFPSQMAKKVEKDKKLSNKADDKYKQSLQGLKEAQEKMFESEMPKVLEVRPLSIYFLLTNCLHLLQQEMQGLEAGRLQLMKSTLDKFTGMYITTSLCPHNYETYFNTLQQQGTRKICFRVPRRLASP